MLRALYNWRAFIEKRLTLVICIATAVFFAGFAAARLLVH
jgi:hypothetical protein